MHPIPTQIGPYRVEAEIGRGDVAVVYRAVDTLYERAVALKVLQPHLAHDLAFVRRFVSAGREAIRLRHPNILPVYDAGQADGSIYVAMALAEGEPLAARLRAGESPFGLDEALEVLGQVAAALDYAHLRGFIHRDLKPSNIFLAAAGKVLVADFDAVGAADDTQPPVYRLGSPAYLAPEQAGGEERVDASADIYSLGAVAYTMLAGRPPFESTNPLGLLRRIVETAPARADTVNPALPAAVVAGLARALSKRPDERPPRAGELIKLLKGEIPAQPQAPAPPAPEPAVPTVAEPPPAEPQPAEPSQLAPSAGDTSALEAMPLAEDAVMPRPPFRFVPLAAPPMAVRPPFVPLVRPVTPATAAAPASQPARRSTLPRLARLRGMPRLGPQMLAGAAIGALALLLIVLAVVQSAGNLMARMATPSPNEAGEVVVVDSVGVKGNVPAVALLPTATPRPAPTVAVGTGTGQPEQQAGQAEDEETPVAATPAATPRRAVVVKATAAATVTAMPSPMPTATAAPPTATPLPSPTATATTPPTPSPTPTETPTATPVPTATLTPTPLPPPADLRGQIAYTLWNRHSDRPDVYIYDVPGRVNATPVPFRRQPDYNLYGELVANAEGGGMDNLVEMGGQGQDPWIISAHPGTHTHTGRPMARWWSLTRRIWATASTGSICRMI
jgi:serine/threonine-protein kinase